MEEEWQESGKCKGAGVGGDEEGASPTQGAHVDTLSADAAQEANAHTQDAQVTVRAPQEAHGHLHHVPACGKEGNQTKRKPNIYGVYSQARSLVLHVCDLSLMSG